MTDAQAGPPIPVKLSNEYTVDLPLWAPDGLPPEDTYPISAGLRLRLMDWAAIFNEHFDWDTGWDEEQRRVAHRAEGLILHRELVDELGPGYEVSFSLWESDTHGAEDLLAGPRGRRLILEIAAGLDAEVGSAVLGLAYDLDPGKGTSRVILAISEGTVHRLTEPTHPSMTVRRLASALTEIDTTGASDESIAAALRAAVDNARYWQEPDGEDVLAAHPLIHAALVPFADHVLASSPLARTWSRERSREQWVIDWRSPDDPAPVPRDPARILADWGREAREEEARAAVERPADPRVNYSGTWWSVPTRLVQSVGHVPAALSLIEDSPGEEEATVSPVRGAGTVYEVRTEYDWTWLCEQFPLEVTASRRHDWFRTTGRDGRWVIPDWEQVATRFDAVHLTTLGYLSAAGRELSVNLPAAPGEGPATVLAGWNPDATLWLTDSVREGEGPHQSWRWSDSDDAWVRDGD